MGNERLTNLYLKRDAIKEALGTGKDYIELEIRGRLVRMRASVTVLEYLNQQIEKLDRQAFASRGPARNIAMKKRCPVRMALSTAFLRFRRFAFSFSRSIQSRR